MSKQACLGGKDIAALLRGEKITAFGVDFVYDATEPYAIQASLNGMPGSARPPFRPHGGPDKRPDMPPEGKREDKKQ